MRLEDVAGRRFGPYRWRVGGEKVDEFIIAAGDLPQRWADEAPPAMAAAALFTAAPSFFTDPAVAPFTKVLVHAEQRFHWLDELRRDAELTVVGTVDSVRERRGLGFVDFTVDVSGATGPVVESHSRFIMAAEPSGALRAKERVLPAAGWKHTDDLPRPVPLAAVGDSLPDMHKSASRADLVRYAGATRDWNPIHWDHESAVAAGLGGIVVHGMLMAAWAMQAATRAVASRSPLVEARFRFRHPVPAGAACVVRSTVGANENGTVRLQAAVATGGVDAVEATMKVQVG